MFERVRNFVKGGRAKVATVTVAGVSFVPLASHAETGPDWSVLTDAIDFGTLGAGLLAAGAALVAVYLTIKGVKIIIAMVRS